MSNKFKIAILKTCCLFIFLLSLGSCVKTGYDASDSSVDYIMAYHPIVHEAELKIVKQDFSEAFSLYDKAFAAVPEPFAIDIYNAAVSAAVVDDQKKAFNYLNQLALKGVSLDYLERQEAFLPLQETKNWNKFKKSYAKNRAKFRRKSNLDLRADLDELYARDQFFRQAKGGLRVHGDTIRKIEDSNVEFLLATIEKYGYPGEHLIGVADTLEQLPRFSIVIQRQTKAKKGYNFEPILREAVQAGRLRPQAAAYLLEQQGQGAYKTKAFVKVSCRSKSGKDCAGAGIAGKLFVEKLTPEQLEQLNAARVALGLDNLANYRKKVVYNEQDKRFKLSNYWSVAKYVVPSKEAASALTEGLTVADLGDAPTQD